MSKIKKALLVLLLTFFFVRTIFVDAESESEKLERLSNEIEQYEQELGKLKSQASTLSNQIAQYDAQIRLTTLKIAQTEEKVLLLGGRINQLEGSLQSLSKAFAKYQYLQRIQEADRSLLVRLENAQVTYQEEKKVQEDLQKELQSQK